jgi:lysine biosynthesis protein LysW
MTSEKNIVSGICPECDSRIRFPEMPALGTLVRCPECRTTLEVIRSSPLKFDWAFEEPFNGRDLSAGLGEVDN